MAEIKTPMRIAGGLAAQFINSKLTPLFIIFSLLLGGFAILRTPREEEPQIVVPMLSMCSCRCRERQQPKWNSESAFPWSDCYAKYPGWSMCTRFRDPACRCS
jgi:hypothetical protein